MEQYKNMGERIVWKNKVHGTTRINCVEEFD